MRPLQFWHRIVAACYSFKEVELMIVQLLALWLVIVVFKITAVNCSLFLGFVAYYPIITS